MKQKKQFGRRILSLVACLLATGSIAFADDSPVIECTGFNPVTMSLRNKDGMYTGKIILPAGQKEYSFSIKDGGQLVSRQTIQFHESVPSYKIAFTYNPATRTVSNDYVAAYTSLDGKVNLNSLYYNSRNETSKSPFGPVPSGTAITFTLEAKTNDLEKANLIVTRQIITGQQNTIENTAKVMYPLQKTGTSHDGTREFWTTTVSFDDIQVYSYYFEAIDGDDVVIYGNNTEAIPIPANKVIGTGGLGEAIRLKAEGISEQDIPLFRQTVYDPSFKTPDWSKDVIFYYIFPERFKNGNPANDPKPGINKYYGKKNIVVHKKWLEKPYTLDDRIPGFEFGNDFFGGDIAGIQQKLDYLKDLGINTIYMTPVFQAPSNHKYDTADFMHIDKNFGANQEYKDLAAAAMEKGIRVIMDASLNHAGSDSVYMDRYGKYPGIGAFKNETIRKDSPYYSWYLFDEKAKNPDQKYPQWANPSLAEFNKNSESYKKFAYKDKNSITQFWMDMGISGWRMDCAPWVPDDFWREWRKVVKAKDPDSLTISEVWWDSSKYLLGDMFDSTMNYIFRQAVLDYVDGKPAVNTVHLMEMLRENYPPEAFFSTMNLLSSHDAPRAVFHFGYKSDNTPPDEIKAAKDKLLLAVFIQMTSPGAPALYYGDEAGVTGGEDPGCRATYPWKEDGGTVDESLFNQYKTLIKLRNDNPVLRRGSAQVVYYDDNVIITARHYGDTTALIATNNSSRPVSVALNLSSLHLPDTWTDALTGGKIGTTNGTLTWEVPATYGNVFLNK